MQLPFFYIASGDSGSAEIELDEENSRHAVQVLRMKKGDHLHLTDGKGLFLTGSILDDHKKRCVVAVQSREQVSPVAKRVTVGISLLKNTSRFEWFLEKATELGVSRIIPLVCKRTEKEKFRWERLKGICISAMLQSRQTWLPQLDEAVFFDKVVPTLDAEQKLIGACDATLARKPLASFSPFTKAVILIGPEGDFTPEEVKFSLSQGFQPVTLGDTRLRTETAGIVAAGVIMSL